MDTKWTVAIERYEGMAGEPELMSVSTAFFVSYEDAVMFWDALDSSKLPSLDDVEFYLIVLYSPEGKHYRSKG